MAIRDNEKIEQPELMAQLYEFESSGITYRYTSYYKSLKLSTYNYIPIPINISQFKDTIDLTNGYCTISFSGVLPDFIKNFGVYPVMPVSFIVRKCLAGNPEDNYIMATGVVSSYTISRQIITLECKTGCYELDKKIPKVFYQSLCNNNPYDSTCGLDVNLYKAKVVVDGITVVNQPAVQNYEHDSFDNGIDNVTNGFYKLGVCINASGEKRMIMYNQDASIYYVLTLHYPFNNLVIGDILTIYPTCQRNINLCDATFNNTENFVGFPYIPSLNPLQWGFQQE